MKIQPRTRTTLLATVAGAAVAASVLMADAGRGMRGPHGPGEHLAAADADGDGSLTAAEWSAVFARLDANSDGVLAGDELPMHRRVLGPPPRGAAAGLVAHDADADDDGAVSREEYAAKLAELDADTDGEVTLAELHARRASHGRRHGGPEGEHGLPPFLAEADSNDDGKLGVDELEAQFAAADVNGDGSLAGDEIGFHRRRGPHGHH